MSRDILLTIYSSAGFPNKGTESTLEDVMHKIRGGLEGPRIRRCREMRECDGAAAYKKYRSKNVRHFSSHAVMPDKSKEIPLDQRIVAFNGLAQIDFDELSPDEMARMDAIARADKHVAAAFVSPSGVGLKFLLRVPVARDLAHWQVIAAAAERYALQAFGRACEHDTLVQGNRLCSFSHDPQAHYNGDSEPIEVGAAPEGTRHQTIKQIVASGVARGLDDQSIHRTVRQQIPDEDKTDDEIDGLIEWTRGQEGKKENPAKPAAAGIQPQVATVATTKPPAPSVREIMLARLYDPASPIPEPDYRLWIKGVPIMSAGNISALVSLPKAGKSSVIVAAIAAGCGEGEYLGLRGANKDRRPIVHLDTEQSKYHHDQKLRTIAKRLGVEQLPDHVVSFRLTGERLGIENVRESVTIAMERTAGKKPYAVLLDGGVDFILDPNDPDASFSMIKDLMAVADDFDCIIVISIHYNPSQQGGPSKSRGHYGSELERKSEAYLTINKDGESGNRSLFTKFARERELPEGEAVRFAWDERAGMFNVLSDEATGYSVDNVLTILEREGGALERTQLKKLLKENVGGDPRTWEVRIKQAHKDLLVTTTGKPAKITLTKNGRCRLETKIEQEDDGHADDPF